MMVTFNFQDKWILDFSKIWIRFLQLIFSFPACNVLYAGNDAFDFLIGER